MSKKNKSAVTFPEGVKFVHLRFASADGQILAGGGTTVAYRRTDAGIEYGVSKCHPRDNYVKSLGRIKANGRLTSKSHKTFVGDEREFQASLEAQMGEFNTAERTWLQLNGVDPDYAVTMFRKYSAKTRAVAVAEEVAE